jgi:hypothetical protein
MSYIILRDTFGRGLETVSNIGLEVIEKHQLNDYICEAAQTTLIEDDEYDSISDYHDDENPSMGEVLVICEIVETIKGKSVDTYILDVLKEKEEKEKKEEYELYLKLKKKFEK